jgi:dUTP pyrophosphatase
MIEVRFAKTHPDAQLPTRAHTDPGVGDSGYDLFAVEDVFIKAWSSAVVPIGIKVAYIEPGYWFRIEGRSGLGFKKGVTPHFGVVDNSYRGDCGTKLYVFADQDVQINKGDRVAQIIFYPLIEADVNWGEVEETKRGEKGFGSTGS